MPPDSSERFAHDSLQRSYALARQHAAPGACIVALHLGPVWSGVAVGSGAVAQTLQLFALGSKRTAGEHFKTTPPTALALEHAIQAVEDGVMPLRALIPRNAQLFCADPAVREIALLSGASAGVDGGADLDAPLRLSLEAMERCFNRLVLVVQGRPAAAEGLPASNAFAAALLILREFMQHLQFADATVVDAPSTP
jgi:exopolyphosphatase/pppGpp-phosphohydrolase